jgi:protoporphyrinogen/coproporphyrinogen III oxidase
MHETLMNRDTQAASPAVSDLVIIGGGISGLTAARDVIRRRPEWSVTVLETEDRPGGTIRTERVAECLCEWGPAGFLTNVPFTRDLALELGLGDRLLPARDAAENRYLWVRGALRPVPLKPPAFLRSDLLTVRGRARVLAEPLVPKRRSGTDESVFGFASRRIGREAAATLVDAMVSGIYAGDSTNLSLRSTFPRMMDMEERYGSLIRAMIALKKAKTKSGGPAGPGGVLTSFDGGMEVLIEALAKTLGPRLLTGARVTGVSRQGSEYVIEALVSGTPRTWRAKQLVLAVPSYIAAKLVHSFAPGLSSELEHIPYAGLSVACLMYRRSQVRHPLNGFGFLVPRDQGLRILGAIWVGSVFPSHVPEDRVLLRVMLGGARDPEGPMLSENRTLDIAHGDVGRALGGIDGAPMTTRMFRHPKAIPQYVLGHPERLERIERELAKYGGLQLAGNAYRGIGVNDCVRESNSLSERMAAAAPVDTGARS